MSIFEALLQHDRVPNFYRVENTRSAPKLEDVAAETRRVMQESGTLEQLKPGQSVCIAAGSREIANIALIVRTVCEVVREHGAEPFIIPAMGSHAGAQAEGQKKILADFGITEEYTGAPIRSSMETVQVGVTKPHGFRRGSTAMRRRRTGSFPSAASSPTRTSAAPSRAASSR